LYNGLFIAAVRFTLQVTVKDQENDTAVMRVDFPQPLFEDLITAFNQPIIILLSLRLVFQGGKEAFSIPVFNGMLKKLLDLICKIFTFSLKSK